MTAQQIALIKLGLDIAEAAGQGVAQAMEAKTLVERMVTEDRDPSPEEWEALNATTDTLHQAIQGA
ncbi:hypothetical protein [Magnetospirillum fulvum]|uniref:Uncharacterized protein n=1 Tax=Magnetospirillum fulvum MGU-K5 TaxID=1316936 RepID=S9S4I1_MAGFU|nr:hypothetical protein [Magnetospirillum fulvum]EPY00867.1 hypothetical protein K678_13905 [Magnetospirillum fulvum MGU-K5]